MKREVLKIISSLTDEELGRIYCEINCWQFPEELKNINIEVYNKYDKDIVYKNAAWKNKADDSDLSHELVDFFYSTLSPIKNIVIDIVGDKYVSKYWNTIFRTDENKFSDEEFEEWWNSDRNLLHTKK